MRVCQTRFGAIGNLRPGLQEFLFLPDVAPDSVRQNASSRLTLTTDGGTQTLYIWPRENEAALATDDGDVTFQWPSHQVDTCLPDPALLRAE